MTRCVSFDPTQFVGLNVGPETRLLQKNLIVQLLTEILGKPPAPRLSLLVEHAALDCQFPVAFCFGKSFVRAREARSRVRLAT